MTGNSLPTETALIDAVVEDLRARFPATWEVDAESRPSTGAKRADAVLTVGAPNGETQAIVLEVKTVAYPKDVDAWLEQVQPLKAPVLFIAPFLSSNAQERLRRAGANFADLTGNLSIRLDYPAVFLQDSGAQANPFAVDSPVGNLTGSEKARVIRALCELPKPIGIRELASYAGPSPGYVSKVVAFLDREGLVSRNERGRVMSADVGGLIRRWVADYRVLKSNRAELFLDPKGVMNSFERVDAIERYAVTGSFACARLVPVADSRTLMVYVEDAKRGREALGLRPADRVGNVWLIEPASAVAFLRPLIAYGVTYVSPYQAAADALSGPDRMPVEGEAVLDWAIRGQVEYRNDGHGGRWFVNGEPGFESRGN